jgi:hypothetical protein
MTTSTETTTAKVYTFPEESALGIRKLNERTDKLHGNKSQLEYATEIIDRYSPDQIYGFLNSFIAENYAPYPHEKAIDNIACFNCTSIVPMLYLEAKERNLEPRIVQFRGFKDTGKDQSEQLVSTSHYSILIKVDEDEYIMDPFYKGFGKISEKGKDYIVVDESKDYSSFKREFKQMLEVSEAEFVEMYERCRTDAGSLDMLVAGQRLYDDLLVNNVRDADVFVYYDDENNSIRTRLQVPVPGVQKRLVYTNMSFTDDGKLNETYFDFTVASLVGWDSTIDEIHVASIPLKPIKAFGDLLEKLVKDSDYQRLSSRMLKPENEEAFSVLLEGASLILQNSVHSDALDRMIFARTLYEFEKPEREFVYDKKEFLKGFVSNLSLLQSLEKGVVGMGQKVKMSHLDLVDDIDGTYAIHADGIKASIELMAKDIDELLLQVFPHEDLRKRNIEHHNRLMDMIHFATHRLKGMSVKDMSKEAEARSLNPMVGYLAILEDFMYLAFDEDPKYITLEFMHDDLGRRIKARIAEKSK